MRMMRGVMAETRGATHQRGAGGRARTKAGHHEDKQSMASPAAQTRYSSHSGLDLLE
jgi:hypothetical protein